MGEQMTTSRARFTAELAGLQRNIGELARQVDDRCARALRALEARDVMLAQTVIDGDSEVNAQRVEIERSCVTLIAEQGPVAVDLRLTIAILFSATELERIGDYAVSIASHVRDIGSDGSLSAVPEILAMADQARAMLAQAVRALLERDEAAARDVGTADDGIDEMQERIHQAIVRHGAGGSVPQIERLSMLQGILHDLERIADRATNIAERAIYVATGGMVELN
jgi:phosphate transport system protein